MAFIKIPESTMQVKLVELTDNCIDKIADAVVRKLADRKTENSSEIPNNCETCRFELYCPEMCEGCCEWDSHYEPRDEPTISKMEQVDKLQTKDYCDICNHKGCEYCISDSRNPYCIPSNYEPQTEGNK